MARPKAPKIYGLVAEFLSPADLVAAAHRARDAGYKRMDGYAPFPIEELPHALGQPHTRLGWLVLAGGVLGCFGGFFLQYYAAVIDYPVNIGGRPLNSWPAFIPVTFECTILGAALMAVFGMLGLNGLPQPYHPLFNLPRFELATRNRFFLCIESSDPKFDREKTREFLQSLSPRDVSEVPY